MSAAGDTVLRCATCHIKQRVNFHEALRDGWPRCHGQTMILVKTTAAMDSAVEACVRGDARNLRQALEREANG